jgi:hypothetical protein
VEEECWLTGRDSGTLARKSTRICSSEDVVYAALEFPSRGVRRCGFGGGELGDSTLRERE